MARAAADGAASSSARRILAPLLVVAQRGARLARGLVEAHQVEVRLFPQRSDADGAEGTVEGAADARRPTVAPLQ